MKLLVREALVQLIKMKVATKTGDKGITGLLSGERLPKSDEVFDTLGDLDELSAAIGLAKVLSSSKDILSGIQVNLINIMGELAYYKNDYNEKFGSLHNDNLIILDSHVDLLQNRKELEQTDWVLYGKTELGARLDFASKVCRRAERKIVGLKFGHLDSNTLIIKYINRLSDYLYLLAREADLCQP